MRRKADLHIRFFNEFSISSPHFEYAPSAQNSTQLTLLISYLVANQDSKVPKDVLMAILWPDEKEKSPVGALRNLVYRARKELQQLYPDQDIDYIKFTQDAYCWNPELYCKLDIIDFENYNNLARLETDPERQYRYYYRMHRLYSGEFLFNHTSVDWVQYRCTYFKNMYINCTLNMCEHLNRKNSYSEIISLCDQSIILYPEEEQFYRHKLMAYIGMNAVKTALEYYRYTVDFFSSKYGTDISESLRDIQQDILSKMPERNLAISELEQNLNTYKGSGETFYCNFDIFKNIYQLNVRSRERAKGKSYLLLLTLTAEEGCLPDTNNVKRIMNDFHDLLLKKLRKNDVFTRTSLTQYSVILNVAADTDVKMIVNRIQLSFRKICSFPEISFEIAEKELI